jgi:hypothetical protein
MFSKSWYDQTEEKPSVTSPVDKIRTLLDLPLMFSKLFQIAPDPSVASHAQCGLDAVYCLYPKQYQVSASVSYITWFPIPVLCPFLFPLAFRRCPIPTSSLANKAISPPPRGLASQSGD